ncbi:MAG: short-chain dehydrogenase [Bacteroidetes bacterium]|nr:short-chain dehydrogenase [Bacteroidota bacterium]MBU1114307.1 short-chain dehydrogenase [Bacteroidota bacterium]MBU1797085.1 short-chain dehydrogenase [Bacteroidota bacterium]
MDIRNKTVLLFGGWGLVGNSLSRKLIDEEPKQIIIASLRKCEAEEQVANLKRDYPHLPENYFIARWGNIFVRHEFKDANRLDLLEQKETRQIVLRDTMEELNDEILHNSSIYKLLEEFKPDIIIDSVNAATGIAYQDIYTMYRDIHQKIETNPSAESMIVLTEKLLCNQYIPQLIRHIQILYSSMFKFNTKMYVKIGTSGTGGMGLNIPYTHSEEKPSRVLLSKSSVAGAHTLLLFLMGRTPEGPITKEIKPTAAIAWKKIIYGEVSKGGKPIELIDIPLESAVELKDNLKFKLDMPFKGTGENLKSVFIDTGENGTFSRGEFEAITAQGQMEFVTPEEISKTIIYEVKGGNTGHDIINALDNASMSPTYRAGIMQNFAVKKLAKLEEIHNTESVAFELLGPPRLSKLLHEINLLRHVAGTMKGIVDTNSEILSEKTYLLLKNDDKLRSEIISIGIPILLPDGKSLLRGNTMKIPPFRGREEIEITEKNIDLWASDGWVDLRELNIIRWQNRLQDLMHEAELIPDEDTSSLHVRNKEYWNNFGKIDIGKVVSWIFIHEEHGLRMKA